MGFPKKIKKDISLTPYRTLYPRRAELLDKINEHGTFLPKSILHADLDKGFLDFVKNELEVVVDGKKIPTVDILITTQSWSQFTQTWNFQDLDKNVSPPFITVIRSPDIKYGSLPSLQYTIPNRRQFYYASVPSFDGDRVSVNVYTIPQPVPVDIKFSLKIICNRMRELNSLNKIVLQKFSSRQSYTEIKGHYIPIIWDNISEESVMDVEKRRYYIQTYDFTMMGFLLDEDEFKVKPAVERVFEIFETNSVDYKMKKRKRNPTSNEFLVDFSGSSVSVNERPYGNLDLDWVANHNVISYDVYINGMYFGSNLPKLQINETDTLGFNIIKENPTEDSFIKFQSVFL
jgi:hypothetical protein